MTMLSEEEAAPLVFILDVVPNIRRFKIMPKDVYWEAMPAPLTAAVLRVISLPSVDALCLGVFHNLPLSLLFHALTSFRVLSINLTETGLYDAAEVEKLYLSSFSPRLEEFSIALWGDATHQMIELVTRSRCLQLLKRLNMGFVGVNTEYQQKLFATVAGSLQHLVLRTGMISKLYLCSPYSTSHRNDRRRRSEYSLPFGSAVSETDLRSEGSTGTACSASVVLHVHSGSPRYDAKYRILGIYGQSISP
jgi:hypothetical protein